MQAGLYNSEFVHNLTHVDSGAELQHVDWDDDVLGSTGSTYSSFACAEIVFHTSTASGTHPTSPPDNPPPRIRHLWRRSVRSLFRCQIVSFASLQAGQDHVWTRTRCITTSYDAFSHLFCIRTHLVRNDRGPRTRDTRYATEGSPRGDSRRGRREADIL